MHAMGVPSHAQWGPSRKERLSVQPATPLKGLGHSCTPSHAVYDGTQNTTTRRGSGEG